MWIANCEVINAGVNASGVVEILLKQLDGNPFNERWFRADAKISKEMLATALAAMAAERRVNIELTALQEWSTITKLLMSKWPL